MDELPSITSMNEQDRQISEIIAEERSRLRNFIRRRVPDPSDAEDILQEVFYKLVEANRLLMPIDHAPTLPSALFRGPPALTYPMIRGGHQEDRGQPYQ